MKLCKDSMGEMQVPDDALWGASTQRAVLNFPVSGHRMPLDFLRGLALIKWAAAQANEQLGLLSPAKAASLRQAAWQIFEGRHLDQFPVDMIQTGSGTSTNTNMNEVIARLAHLEAEPGTPPLHPNDEVNLGQSSNDVIPTALHLSVALSLRRNLAPALLALQCELAAKALEFDGIVKIGRTHLMDATPLTLGQEFSGYAMQLRKSGERVERAITILCGLAIGGTAVGTGLNTHPEFAGRVCRLLSEETGLPFHEARNHFEAQASRDDCVEVAGQLTAIAASLTKIANDLRLLGSGPRAGLAELRLPAVQPGSSIMPGKVNPVMCEMLVQVGLYVQGMCQTVMACGREGQLELNATMPLMAHCLHEAIQCLSNATRLFAVKCVIGIQADAQRCSDFANRSLSLVTALTPFLGYDQAAHIAKTAFETGRSLKEVVLASGLMQGPALDEALNPASMVKHRNVPPQALSAPETIWENEGGHIA